MNALASGCHAIVADPLGVATTLQVYSDAGALASVQLDPASAVGLGSDLIEAARVRLGWARSPCPSACQGAGSSRFAVVGRLEPSKPPSGLENDSTERSE